MGFNSGFKGLTWLRACTNSLNVRWHYKKSRGLNFVILKSTFVSKTISSGTTEILQMMQRLTH